MVKDCYLKISALLLVGTVATAHAQTLPAGDPPPPIVAPGSDPTGGTNADPNLGASSSPPGAMDAPPATYDPGAPSGFNPYLAPALPPRLVLPPLVHHRFRAGRIVNNVGTTIGFIGSTLTLTSIIVSGVYGLGLDQSEDQITGRIGPGLAYAGSSATGAGFIMATTGLGLQHSALALVGQDPGRGMYGTGTALGILGLCGIGTSYFFVLTRYTENATVIAFSASIAAGTLLTISSILFLNDATRLASVYRRLTTF